MNNHLQQAAAWIRTAKHLLVFTGAGISAESGIPTFRDEQGFWQRFPPERFATWNGLIATAVRKPRLLAEFVHAVIEPIANALPNEAHLAIAAAEQHVPITVVTQNIDGLHQDAGSTIVHEIHGSILEIVSRSGRFRSFIQRRELQQIASAIHRAGRSFFTLPRLLLAMRRILGLGIRGIHHPHLVLFGDSMAEPAWTNAFNAAHNADCVVQIGCSGMVYPAAMLPHEAKARGARIIAVDPHEAEADIWLQGTATDWATKLFQAAFDGIDTES